MEIGDFILANPCISNDVDLAEALYLSQIFWSVSRIKDIKIVKEVLSQCPTREDVINKIIDLCGKPETPRQRFLLAISHAWSRNKNLKEQAIYYIELYLHNELYPDAYSIYQTESIGDFQLTPVKKHIANMHRFLGESYETIRKFDKAMDCYKIAYEINPTSATSICNIGSLFVRQNQLEKALNLYYNARQSPYYKPREVVIFGEKRYIGAFDIAIEKRVKFLEDKLQKGYIYNERKGWIKKPLSENN